MWTNIKMFFGNQSEITQNEKTIKDYFDLAWNLSVENQEWKVLKILMKILIKILFFCHFY